MERIACEQIYSFLEKSDLLDSRQAAYRRSHSTQTCLIGLFDIRHAVDQRRVTVCVLFDFSKAFNRVQHKILIDKLKGLHLSYSVLTWVASYLTGRTQVIRDSGSGSVSNLNITASVPQGSVLGLFSLYLSDFGSTQHCRYNFYADDLIIYLDCEPCRLMEAISGINEDITSIVYWATANQLVLN